MILPYQIVGRFAPRRDRIWASAALLAMGGIVLYLLLARAVDADFTDYWAWLVGGAAVTLAVVAVLHGVAAETGLAPMTYLLAIASTVAQTLGTAGHLYARIGTYDKLTHFVTPAMIAAGSYEVFAILVRRGKLDWTPAQRALAVVAVGIAIGIGWEIYEYVGDVVVHVGARTGGWPDTLTDLVADTCGAVVVAALLWRRELRSRDGSLGGLP
jgi:hypothetical protein